MKLPSKIDGIDRQNNKVKAIDIVGGKNYVKALNSVGNNEVVIKNIPGTTIYTARDCEGNTASDSTAEGAIARLKKENPGKNYIVK